MTRTFVYPPPTFSAKDNPLYKLQLEVSPYYWWWAYLRRNLDYRATCKNGGKGKCAKLYADFGDVHGTDFQTWWETDDRGANLFAEPSVPDIKVVTLGNAHQSMTPHTILLAVQLNQSMGKLIKEFRETINSLQSDGQTVNPKSGRQAVKRKQGGHAKYRITGKVDTEFFEKALAVWDVKLANPKMSLWEIGTLLKVVPPKSLIVGGETEAELLDKKNILAATTSRLLRKAGAMITSAAKGYFPISRSLKEALKDRSEILEF